MAQVKLHPLLREFSGTLGNVVFKTSSTGKIYMSQRPRKSNKKPSEAQKAHRQHFAEASKYAKAALADPDMRAHYEARAAQEGKGAFALARADYLNGRIPSLLSEGTS